jgi:hypothetical protein
LAVTPSITRFTKQNEFLIQVVAVKLSWFGRIWEMYSVRLLPIYKPVGRGDEALIVAARLFALIPLHRLKRTDSVNVPMSSNDLAIGSANSGANNYFGRPGAQIHSTQPVSKNLPNRHLHF